jgi:hypothetical protein
VNVLSDPSDVAGNLELSTSEAGTQSELPQRFTDARINFISNTTLQVPATIPKQGAYRPVDSTQAQLLEPPNLTKVVANPSAATALPTYSSFSQHRKYGSGKVGAYAGVGAHWYVLEFLAALALVAVAMLFVNSC